MRFSVVLATCMEGLLYPIPFVEADTFSRVAIAAERLGYHSVWGNDHITTQRYVQARFDRPPSYFDPLISLAALAPVTRTLRLGIAVIVIPTRHPVILAKQIASLDFVSSGRLQVVAGIGAYREEFDAMNPDSREVNRGEFLEEGIMSLLALFKERRASFRGKYIHFEEVESYPKPVQRPFPLYVGGNSEKNMIRAGRWGMGWFPAVLSPQELRAGVQKMREEADRCGRGDIAFEVGPQYAVSLGKTNEAAIARLRESHLYVHMVSLEKTTLKGQASDIIGRNLVGTPDHVLRQIHALEDAGMTHCAALLFPANSVQEMLDQMEEFAELVMQQY